MKRLNERTVQAPQSSDLVWVDSEIVFSPLENPEIVLQLIRVIELVGRARSVDVFDRLLFHSFRLGTVTDREIDPSRAMQEYTGHALQPSANMPNLAGIRKLAALIGRLG